ncbi:MAG: lmo0937 family membrane protein [Bacteroidia bacterium]
MRSLLYIIAVLLIIGWALGSFAWHTTSALIHLLLVVAVVMILFNLISGRRRPL